jgi:DhnA family fructose-bisphosphate aldolase class Ia
MRSSTQHRSVFRHDTHSKVEERLQRQRTRLHWRSYKRGPGNGTMLLFPMDRGLEHGPRDCLPSEPSENPGCQLRLAEEGGSSGIALHIGLAQKYIRAYAGEVPLILTLNGGTGIPSDGHHFSPQVASVEDAVRLGPDGVKLKSPEFDSGRQDQYPKEQMELAISPAYAMNKVVRPAGKTLILLS